MESLSSFERSVYTEFFELISTNDCKNLDVKCKLCPPTRKTYRTSANSTSNLKKHLEVIMKLVLVSLNQVNLAFETLKCCSFFEPIEMSKSSSN